MKNFLYIAIPYVVLLVAVVLLASCDQPERGCMRHSADSMNAPVVNACNP